MRQFKTVFKFEYMNYFKSKVFIGLTVGFMLIAIIAGSIPIFYAGFSAIKNKFAADLGNGDEMKNAAIMDDSGVYTDEILQKYMPELHWEHLNSIDGIENKLTDGSYHFVIVVEGLDYTVYEKSAMIPLDTSKISQMLVDANRHMAFSGLGVSAEVEENITQMAANPTIKIVGKDISQSFWLAYTLLMLLYITIILYGQYILMSVATEKSSKAMELLITSAKPFCLMLGKVLGTGAVGLTQFALILLAGFGSFRLNLGGWSQLSPAVASIVSFSASPQMFLCAIVYFVLAFFSIAFIYAAIGSTVSRIEEVNTVSTVPSLVSVAGFLVAMLGMTAADATWFVVCSYVPFLSPMVMFVRICVTNVAAYEIIISIVLNIGYLLVLCLLCAKIYRVGVMLYGNKIKLSTIIKYMRES